ncbi:MAG: hypothetical protein QOG63_2146 [Thermoleophilaceae bacterium]|nr:hypothetical protein [Thermoleophilaceae bacterium]
MGVRRTWLVALALVPATFPAGAVAAAPKPPLRSVGTPENANAVLTGRRMAAFRDPAGTIHLYHDGHGWRAITAPSTCDGRPAALRAVGSGLALFEARCDDSAPPAGLVLRVATGAVTPAAPFGNESERPGGDWLDAIGAHWVKVLSWGYHWHDRRYVDWRTGAVKHEDDAGSHRYPNLDRPGLFAPICRPLRRRENLDDDAYDNGPPWLYYDQAGGWGVTQLKEYATRANQPTLVLQRCGARRPRIELPWGVLGRGIVAWAEPRGGVEYRVHVLRLRDGRRFSWRANAWQSPVVSVAGRRVFVTGEFYDHRTRVLSARIPR